MASSLTQSGSPLPVKLTAEQFVRDYAGQHAELVDGRVVELPMPQQRHGDICFRILMALGPYIRSRDLGYVTTNDSFVKTTDQPERVRGADICYFSYDRLPKGGMPSGLLNVSPDLAIEVRSPNDRWNGVFTKVGEYLAAGVKVVVVVDEDSRSASVYRNEEFQQIFDNGDMFVLPELFPDFACPVKEFFD